MLHPSDDIPPRQATLAGWQANRHCAGKEEKQQRLTSSLFFCSISSVQATMYMVKVMTEWSRFPWKSPGPETAGQDPTHGW